MVKTEQQLRDRFYYIQAELNLMPNKQTWKRRMLIKEYQILKEILE